MTFGSAVRTGFGKYATFEGRASRSEFWWWILFVNIITCTVIVLGSVLTATGTRPDKELTTLAYVGFGFYAAWLIFSLATIVPSFAVSVRRLHDLDVSGWWFLLPILPGSLVYLIWMCTGGKPGVNRFGPSTTGDIADVFGDGRLGYPGPATSSAMPATLPQSGAAPLGGQPARSQAAQWKS